YMSPEQAQGRTHQIGPPTDVYALGAILYELLTGRPPFRAETPMETIMQVISQDPVPPRNLQPKLPRDVETICLKCLQKNLAHRYGSAKEFADDLERFLTGVPIKARPVSLWERTTKFVRRHPSVASLAVLGCLLGVGGYLALQLQHPVVGLLALIVPVAL